MDIQTSIEILDVTCLIHDLLLILNSHHHQLTKVGTTATIIDLHHTAIVLVSTVRFSAIHASTSGFSLGIIDFKCHYHFFDFFHFM